jgi:hypothetical protein
MDNFPQISISNCRLIMESYRSNALYFHELTWFCCAILGVPIFEFYTNTIGSSDLFHCIGALVDNNIAVVVLLDTSAI